MGSHTILCIDDNQNALHIRKLVLESAGYSVLTALNGEDALRIFQSPASVHLVISDHFLQGETGAQITARMKQLKPHVPVMILSGAVDKPAGVHHADLFLTKTGNPAAFLQAIANLLP